MRFFAAALILSIAPATASAGPLDEFREAAIAAEERTRTAVRAMECTAEIAEQVSFADFAVNSAAYMGRCVTVRGVAWGNMLFESPDHLYLADRFDPLYADRRIRVTNPFRIGIQGHEFDTPEIGMSFHDVAVTGIALDCIVELDREYRVEAIEAMTSGQLIISSGHDFCAWYVEAAVIDPRAFRFGERRIARRRLGSDSERFGSLWRIPSTSPLMAALSASSLGFLERMRGGDRLLVDDLGGASDGWVAQLYGAWYSQELRSLRTGRGVPQMVHFWQIPPNRDVEPVEGEIHQRVWTCFCGEADCSQKWPISETDALPTPDQPYLCIVHYASGESLDQLAFQPQTGRRPFRGRASPFRDLRSPP